MAVPPALTETQAIQHLIAGQGAGAAKAAAAAGLDREAIREVLTAKAAAAKAGTSAAAVPFGVEPDIFRQTLAAKAGGAKTAAASAAKVGMTQGGMTAVQPDIIREAIVSKAISGTGGTVAAKTTAEAVTAGTIWSGKGFSLGLGLGLGIWGPLIVVAAGAAAVYGYLQYRQRPLDGSDEQVAENTDEGFYPEKA